jgi:hypothetical protein
VSSREVRVAGELPDPSNGEQVLTVAAQIEARIARLDLVAELEAAGHPYSELDESGRIVTHMPERSCDTALPQGGLD